MDWLDERTKRVMSIFFPENFKRLQYAFNTGQKFAHYTSASNALQILSSGEIWMRKSSVMNDCREFDHGHDLLNFAAHQGHLRRMDNVLNSAFPGCFAQAISEFDTKLADLQRNTFLCCFSAHKPVEDTLGRLSMWRAYGGDAGVAIVLNGNVFFRDSAGLGIYSSPVSYTDPSQFESFCGEVIRNIEEQIPFVQSLGEQFVRQLMFEMLRSVVLATKHKGFAEEEEWRVFHTPGIEADSITIRSVENVRGVPQLVRKIPLQKALPRDMSLDTALDRIIIGPTQFPFEIQEAFAETLSLLGVRDPDRRVVVSQIPLRNA